jgi:hypothetical protein
VEVPECADSSTPGREQRVIQVVCTNKYSTSPEVLKFKEDLGATFNLLFIEERTQILKPNAEDLIRNLLTELGIQGEELETSMGALFEERVSVSTAAGYEQEEKKLPDETRSVLSQLVKRTNPSLRFP